MNMTPSEVLSLVDAHCHLQDERLAPVLPEVMNRARLAGVHSMVCCGLSEEDWAAVLQLAEQFRGAVIPVLGLHPWYIKNRSTHWLERLSELLRAHPEAGVGECGLDHAIEDRDDTDQDKVLIAQLDLARELKRPVWLHSRRAWGRLPDLLTEWGRHEPGVVIHSYSGPVELIQSLSDLNVYFSFSGSITRSNNRRGRAAAAAVPSERLLVETDAPDLPPVIREAPPGETRVPEINEPANLVYVVSALAEVRGWTVLETAQITTANAKRVVSALGES